MTDGSLQLVINRVGKKFGTMTALQDVSFSVLKGEFVVLLGPSGCGKTSLLNIIAGIIDADEGTLILEGQTINGTPIHRRDIGFVFQNYALFPHMNVEANIRFGLEMRPIAEKEIRRRVGEALTMVGLETYAARMPQDLSGGQQQRVAIARALIIRPRLLLLDEPLSNLDAVTRKSVRVELRQLHERSHLTTVMVTHDQEEAMSMADRVIVMSEGVVLQHDTPRRIYESPATDFIAGFVGNPPAVLVDLTPKEDGGWLMGTSFLEVETALGDKLTSAPRQPLRLALRPEHLMFVGEADPADFTGKIGASEYVGGSWLIYVDIGSTRLIVHAQVPPPPSGTRVRLGIDPAVGGDALLLYAQDSGKRMMFS